MWFEVCTNDEFLKQTFFFPYLPRFESKNLTLSQKNKKLSFSWKISDECDIKHVIWSMHAWQILISRITFLFSTCSDLKANSLTLSQKNKKMSFTWKWKISDECKKNVCMHSMENFRWMKYKTLDLKYAYKANSQITFYFFSFLYLVRFENKKLHFQSKKTRKCHSHGKFQIDVIQTCDLKYAHTTNSQNTH